MKIYHHLFPSIEKNSRPNEIEAQGLVIWEVGRLILSYSICHQCDRVRWYSAGKLRIVFLHARQARGNNNRLVQISGIKNGNYMRSSAPTVVEVLKSE